MISLVCANAQRGSPALRYGARTYPSQASRPPHLIILLLHMALRHGSHERSGRTSFSRASRSARAWGCAKCGTFQREPHAGRDRRKAGGRQESLPRHHTSAPRMLATLPGTSAGPVPRIGDGGHYIPRSRQPSLRLASAVKHICRTGAGRGSAAWVWSGFGRVEVPKSVQSGQVRSGTVVNEAWNQVASGCR